MTENKFIKAAKEGKTVLCMDYIEGDSKNTVTGISGDIATILNVLATKTICLFLKIYKQNPKQTKEMLRDFLQSIDEGTTLTIAKAEENPEILDSF